MENKPASSLVVFFLCLYIYFAYMNILITLYVIYIIIDVTLAEKENKNDDGKRY